MIHCNLKMLCCELNEINTELARISLFIVKLNLGCLLQNMAFPNDIGILRFGLKSHQGSEREYTNEAS